MSDLLTLEDADLQDYFNNEGWTDGLPVIAPTPVRVTAMLAGAELDGDELLGSVSTHGVAMSAQHAAVAAVMAGCRPDYFPVVVAALGAALDPAFNLAVACTSTGGASILVIVSGPLADEIGMNARHNALASGNRANATIGRSVRLAATNLLRTKVDGIDGTSLGHPGKYTFCVAEREPTTWTTLRGDLGYGPEDTTVTVLGAAAPLQIANHLNGTAEGVAASLAAAMRVPSQFTTGKGGAQYVVVLGPEHEAALAGAGWSRRHVQSWLRAHSEVAARELADAGIGLEVGSHHSMEPDERGMLVTVESDEDVIVLTAGGAGAGWSAVVPNWAPKKHSSSVTRRVRLRGEGLPPCGPDGCVIDWDAMERHS